MKWLFKKKSDYARRSDGKKWTKNLALKQIAQEWVSLKPALKGNLMTFAGDPYLQIEFIASNYGEENELNLNGTIAFQIGDKYLFWCDLFGYAKCCYGQKYQALSLHKDEQWEGSRIQKECQEVFLPMLSVVLSPQTRLSFMNGKPVQFKGKPVQPACSAVNITPHLQ